MTKSVIIRIIIFPRPVLYCVFAKEILFSDMLSPVLSPIIALPLSFSSSAAPHLTGTYKGLSTTILLRSILCETKIAIFLLLFSPLFIDNKIPFFLSLYSSRRISTGKIKYIINSEQTEIAFKRLIKTACRSCCFYSVRRQYIVVQSINKPRRKCIAAAYSVCNSYIILRRCINLLFSSS